MDNLTPPGQTGPPTLGRGFDRSCQAGFPVALCRPGTQNLLVRRQAAIRENSTLA